MYEIGACPGPCPDRNCAHLVPIAVPGPDRLCTQIYIPACINNRKYMLYFLRIFLLMFTLMSKKVANSDT